MDAREILAAALRQAPRRYRLPPLPSDGDGAAAAGAEVALAYAIEQRRLGAGAEDRQLQALFTRSLAALVSAASAPEGGDPAFQALVLRAHSPAVQACIQADAARAADERAVRSAVNALAHPGRLRGAADAAHLQAMARLRELLAAKAWPALQASLGTETAAGAALARLVRSADLEADPDVQRYRALCGLRGPPAGSAAAASQGREGARSGAAAEKATVEALRVIAGLLVPRAAGGPWRVLRSLRTPPGFPGDAAKAKDEWDVVLACEAAGSTDIVLLAEVKAAPSAATNDYARLQRGLVRLAQAAGEAPWTFATADGNVKVSGRSLRELAPLGRELPAHVIYSCTAPVEPQPQLLGAAARAVLLGEPACVALAQRLADGEAPSADGLRPVWLALGEAPHLRAALHQYETARLAREAMLHPDDLVAAVRAAV